MTRLIQVVDVLDQLSLPDSSELTVGYCLDAAGELIEGYVGPVLPRSYTETVTVSPVIVLSRSPVISLDAMAAVYPNDAYYGFIYDVANYHLDGRRGIIRRIPQYGYAGNYGGSPHSGSGYSGLVTVTYTAGLTEVPEVMRQASLLLVQQMLGERRGAAPLPAIGGPGVDVSSTFGRLPGDVAEMLAPFRRGSVVA